MFSRLGNLLHNRFSRKDDLSRQVAIAKVLDLCRQELAGRFPNEAIEVVSLKHQTLTLRVGNSPLVSELRLTEGKLLAKLNEVFGADTIKKIRYVF